MGLFTEEALKCEGFTELLKKVKASGITNECVKFLNLAEEMQYYAIYKEEKDSEESNDNLENTDSCLLHSMTHEHTEILGEFCDKIVPSTQELKEILVIGLNEWRKRPGKYNYGIDENG